MASLVVTILVAIAAAAVATQKPAEAAFPGKNGRIAFYSYQDGDSEIYKMLPDGSQLK
jgi:hypothetical protein